MTAKERRENQACVDELRPLLRKLQNVDGRLDIGLSNADYGTALGGVSVTYNRANFRNPDLNVACVALIGAPLESAFNAYIAADDRWDNCINDYGCDVDTDALPFLRAKWSQASTKINRAESRFNHLERSLRE